MADFTIEDDNTLKYDGDIKSLPHCRVCVPGVDDTESVLEHELKTFEHPYKMKESAPSALLPDIEDDIKAEEI